MPELQQNLMVYNQRSPEWLELAEKTAHAAEWSVAPYEQEDAAIAAIQKNRTQFGAALVLLTGRQDPMTHGGSKFMSFQGRNLIEFTEGSGLPHMLIATSPGLVRAFHYGESSSNTFVQTSSFIGAKRRLTKFLGSVSAAKAIE